ncbi:septal ring lytic transglycosylase RlpA family protein [Salinisphaera sp. LB1]|uniref:septal ring lytic transglycosylase RlpA family protein n=1 Tax=Salinisphaera sp. LB1 TaxID=2183911 RepID=UPI000D7067B7|nr:septal ring lytic transglycosylase RlpA family protein [Salinisphaera sp. LB1]AWN14382.1 Rare lipoprotein A precursor [Salinisphaera sp. LB1]
MKLAPHRLGRLLVVGGMLALAGCASGPAHKPQKSHGGGYYQNDGPPADTHIDWSKVHDAVPRNVPPSKHGNPTSYTALGKRYYVLKSAKGFTQTGRASWYGRQFNGQRTSSGQPYNMFAMTAAHKRLPIPTWVRVTNLDNHKQVVVKINDRGPFHKGRIIDLSYVAARRLGIVGEGSAPVRIHTVTPATIDQPDTDNGASGSAQPSAPLRRAENPPADGQPAHHAGPSRVADHTSASPASSGAPARSSHDAAKAAPLQIGAFSSAAHASRAKARARAAGVGPVAVIPPSSNMKLYRVRVGPFSSLAAQARAKQQLADAGLPVREIKR